MTPAEGPPAPTTTLARAGTGRAALAVAGLFAANGVVVGAFGGSLPGQRARLGLGDHQIVGMLVAAGVMAVVSMNVGGRLADRSGARMPALLGAAVMLVGTVVLAASPNYLVLLVGACVLGLGNGSMDVCMNALGVAVEQVGRRAVMSRLHASFSLGNAIGALFIVAWGTALVPGTAARIALLTAGVLLAVLVGVVLAWLPQSAATEAPVEAARRGRIPQAAWLLAIMAVCFGLTEGTGIDWSSLHVTEVTHVSASQGAWGLAAMSGTMVAIRLAGDSIVARLGRAPVVRYGAGTALLGYVLTVLAHDLGPVLVGWALVGLGVGLVAPQIYGLAGHVGGGRGLAVVVSFGYAAFLVGPAVIGAVAARADLQRAMLVPTVTAVGLVLLSWRMPTDP